MLCILSLLARTQVLHGVWGRGTGEGAINTMQFPCCLNFAHLVRECIAAIGGMREEVTSLSVYSVVGNVTSKCSGVKHYRLCHVLRVITFRSDKGSVSDRA